MKMCKFDGILIATDLTVRCFKQKQACGELFGFRAVQGRRRADYVCDRRVVWWMSPLCPLTEIVNAPMVLCNGATLYDLSGAGHIYDLLDEDDT